MRFTALAAIYTVAWVIFHRTHLFCFNRGCSVGRWVGPTGNLILLYLLYLCCILLCASRLFSPAPREDHRFSFIINPDVSLCTLAMWLAWTLPDTPQGCPGRSVYFTYFMIPRPFQYHTSSTSLSYLGFFTIIPLLHEHFPLDIRMTSMISYTNNSRHT